MKTNLVIVRTIKQFKEMKRAMRGTVSLDLETASDDKALGGLYPWARGARITSFGIGTKDTQWCLPVTHPQSPWDPDVVETMIVELCELLESCFVVCHNGKFDLLWLRVLYGITMSFEFDTMLADYAVDENRRHGLDNLAAYFFGAPNWDVDNDTKFGRKGFKPMAEYQAWDLLYTRELRFPLGKLLRKDGDTKRIFDEILMPCARLFIEVEYDGVPVDVSKMREAKLYLRSRVVKAEKRMRKWGNINWGSTQQLAKLLFDPKRQGGLGLTVVEKTKKGAISTKESVIKRIDHPIARDILKFRGAKQQLSFFIEGWRPYLVKKGKQWFIHPSFKLHGTVTGRLSCEHPNLQQVPRDPRIRSLIIAMPGWELCEADLSQIELRIAAELAQERTMIDAFRRGLDVHWITAMRELERGGGGKHVGTIIRTAEVHLVRQGLQPDGKCAKVLLRVWEANKERQSTTELLRLARETWDNQKSRGRIGRGSTGIEKSILERGLSDLAKEISQDTLRALQQYTACLSSSQERKQSRLEKVKFTDAMQIVSQIGASEAETIQKTWGEKDPEMVWKEIRKKAKAVAFGYLYGMWWKKFKIYARDNYDVIVTDEEAQESRKGFFALYPDFVPWHSQQKRYARMNGYVRSLSGRKRRLPDAMDLHDTPYRQSAERQAVNSPVQSFANEINLMAALQMREEFGRDVVRIVGTVHDSILFLVKKTHVEKVVKRLLVIMSRPKLFDLFDIKLSVPVEAEAKIGSWGASTEFHKWVTSSKQAKAR